MPTTLPEFNKLIDNFFTETWYEIRSQARDQVLESTVVWNLLKNKGCFVPQTGGELITRTISYATGPTPVDVAKGDLLPQGTVETETMATWTFRNVATSVQRDLITDVENMGSFKIADYVARRMTHTMDALGQRFETQLERAHVTDESGKAIQGLNDILPPPATRSTGTYGSITRCSAYTQDSSTLVDTPSAGSTNPWWSPRYKEFGANIEISLVDDFKNFFNVVTNQQESPDIILTSQTVFELYESWGLDAVQAMLNEKMMNLGFEVLKFKGADLTYTPNITGNYAKFLNSRRIEVVYNPSLWFEMTEWKQAPLEMRKIAHILCRLNIITDEPRRHGLLYPNS